MSARSMMRMRCTIKRDTQSGRDDFNQPAPPHWEIVETDVHCHVWAGSSGGKHTSSGGIDGVLTITSDMPGSLFPRGTDIKEGDKVVDIVDRRGQALAFPDMMVDAVLPRMTHLEARLVEYA